MRMLPDSLDPATDHAEPCRGAVQGTRPLGARNPTAQSGRRNSVSAALTFTGGFSAARQRIREWLYDGADRSAPSPNLIDVRARFRAADAMGAVAVEVRRPRACRRYDNALQEAARYRRERGLSGMRHPSGVGARQQTGQADRPGARAANRSSIAVPPRMRAIAMTDRGLRCPNLWKRYARSDGIRTCAGA